MGRARAAVMLVLDEAERVETGGLDAGCGGAEIATSGARRIAQPVEHDRVADELVVDEHARQGLVIGGVKAQLDGLADELGDDLE